MVSVKSIGVSLSEQYLAVRKQSVDICQPLEIEDYQVQPMTDASPPKWHLAHVTWFFETFILKSFVPGYRPFEESYEVLFNSYYIGVGNQFPRSRRGTLSRPTVSEVLRYREHVDANMLALLDSDASDEVVFKITLGLHHEQQHQELLFTDLKYNFGNNPLAPAYNGCQTLPGGHSEPLAFSGYQGGVYQIGVDAGNEFAFDNESPRHDVLVRDFALADRLVTNGEFLEFMMDDGYSRPELWLSDAWTLRQTLGEDAWTHPLYWRVQGDGYEEYTLSGLQTLNPEQPVCHVSAYEADAYARWKGMRLPTEMEWEVAVQKQEKTGNFAEDGYCHPIPATGPGMNELYGNLWEWTQSSYGPYPGFKPFPGQLGEYNGKFMANQLVLRGGSCVTPQSHIRPSYRNFFYAGDRWQFSGIRLAHDQD